MASLPWLTALRVHASQERQEFHSRIAAANTIPPPPLTELAPYAGGTAVLRGFAASSGDMHDDFKPQFKAEPSGSPVDEAIRQDVTNNKVLLYMKVGTLCVHCFRGRLLSNLQREPCRLCPKI